MPLLTSSSVFVAPSQALAELSQDPLRHRSASRLNVLDEDDSWENTVRHLPLSLEPPTSRSAAHSRESSLDKSIGLAGIPESPPPSAGPISSPRLPTSAGSRQGFAGILERVIDSKTAAYGHHRQTSIVHGFQHSRNGSLASTSSSPLSPQMIAAAGVGLLNDRTEPLGTGRTETDATMASRPPTALSGSTANSSMHPTLERTSSTTESNSGNSGNSGTLTQRRVERMHSRSRRDHSHHPSHSSRHHNEQKTVGEYALHVLFTHVSWEMAMNPL